MLRNKTLRQWMGLGSRAGIRQRRKRPVTQVVTAETLEDRKMLSAEYFVANGGDDWASGAVDQPFQTIRRALDAAHPGDTITLRNGVYEGGINIDVSNLTIRSMPGEWAVVEAPLTEQTDGHSNSVFRYGYDIQGGKLENLEISGGYWYGVMMWDWWDSNFDAGSTHVGASNITIDGCKIHDTGVDAIKITPGANDISILNTEIYNTGRRSNTSSDGIDNNNGDRMIARGNYIHDIDGVGILTAGGAEDSLIEQNLIVQTRGAGINVGFYSELEWMEPATNPNLYLSIDNVARNNIIVNAGQAGIGIYGAANPLVTNNTIVNAASQAQAPIQFGFDDIWVGDNVPYQHVASVNPVVENNIITTDPSNLTRMIDIRQGSIDPAAPLTLDHNLYHGTSTRGILFIDRNLTGDGTPEQTLSQWQANYGYDTHSLLAEPQLGADWHLLSTSPAIGKAISVGGLTKDFDGNLRADGAPDLGADEFNAGSNLATPPAPFGAPALEIAETGYHDFESNTINVRIVRHGSADDTVTVQFSTLEGTAKAGIDFNAVAGTLTFAPGETEKVVTVSLLGDGLAEGDEHFLFTLSNPTTDGSFPVRLGHQSTASMTIDDAETPETVTYATKWVSNSGSDITGDGTEAHPWKSLQFAADNVGPGDYVIVTPGNYWGMSMTTDGKADARITFHAMPGVVIDEPDPESHQDGINLEGADYVTIEGFEIHDMPRAGLRAVNNTHAIFRDNISDHNGIWGLLTGWSDHILVENNVMSRSQEQHGIYISNSSDDGIIRNNIVWGNYDSGIQFNGDGSLEGDGVHSRNIIEGNTVYDNGIHGGSAINLDGFQDGIVRNNLLYNNHATGIVLYVDYAADSSTNNLVTNNTVVMAPDARWALLMWNGSSGNVVTNNILLNQNPIHGSMTVETNSLPAISDNNVLQNLFEINGSTSNFAGWQAFSGGLDSHSVFASLSDLFVDPANHDFHLKAGSPAIDAGDAAHAAAVDIFQHVRPAGASVDIGAFEAGNFAPTVQFESDNVIGYEFIGISEVAVTRSGDTEGALAVEVTTTNGTAGSADYQAVRGYLIFQPGEARATFHIFVNDDLEIENNETVNLQLRVVGDPTGLIPAGLVADATGLIPINPGEEAVGNFPTDQATLHLVSDDAWKPGTFQFNTSNVTFNEADGTATVTVYRVGGSNGAAQVDYLTGAFTPPKKVTWEKRHTDLLYPTDNDTPATVGDDYFAQQGTLDFADGETFKTITIPIVNDSWYEGGEAFMLHLSNPTNGAAVGQQSQLKVRIDSDDVKQAGTFVFASPTYSVTEGTPFLNVTVDRINGGNVAASVQLYDTGAGNGSTTASAWAGADYGFLPWILDFAPGEMSKTISIPITDDQSTELDEVFSIQLYSPSNDATVGAVATTFATIHDNESTFYFKAADNSAAFSSVEGTGNMPITVYRQGSVATAASVQISTGDWGSAIPNVDFVPVNVTVVFAPGETSKTINVPIINDSLMEAKESFPVNMSNAIGATQGSWTWSANIVDDDVAASPGKLQLSNSTYSVNEDGTMLNVTVNRVGGADGTVSVQYKTSDGASGIASNLTAWAGADYTSKSGTLTFAPGETSKVISIPITNDTSVEQNEYFTVTLSNPVGGATLGPVTKAVVTIVEDDSSIEFAQSNYSVNENAGYVTITLTRKGNISGVSTIDLNLSSGPATAGQDFVKPASPTVTFAAGESTKTIQIQIIDDVFKESDEFFYLQLTNATGAKLGSSLYGSVTIKDND